MLTDLRRRRRSKILEVVRSRCALRVRVFGSIARGDATERSDIDFLVDLKAERGLPASSSLAVSDGAAAPVLSTTPSSSPAHAAVVAASTSGK
jgi:predicted nucleotidyltransferase